MAEEGKGERDPSAADAAQEVDVLRSQLEEERQKAQGYLDNWRRAAADLQNYKRRTEQEREDVARLANASLIFNLLPVLDDFQRAFHSLDVRLVGLTWFDGIRLIQRKLWLALEAAGVREIPTDGQEFDPRYHEAIMQAEGDEGKILAEVQKGYMLGDRVLRPALVVVGRGKGEKAERGEGERPQEGGGQ
ncbi:MAG TPA: nucleotide exchange factor GrpE [Dehalococcoidia bacterium]|nr:nucleotide exchange factor GrpE [Dehalococcoidia bacterium]